MLGGKNENSRRDEIGVRGDRKGDREESVDFQCVDQFVNLERRKDRQVAWSPSIRAYSIHSNHIS